MGGGAAVEPGLRPGQAKTRQSIHEELQALWRQPEEPGLPEVSTPNPLANLKNLPKLITEGIPAAGRAIVQGQAEPTYGQLLQQRFPAIGKYTPIPGAMDLAARAFRLPSSVARGVAEMGPEQAKPLTEQLAVGLMNLSPLLRRPAAPRPVNIGEVPLQQPALPGPPRFALGPSELKPRPPGPWGQYVSWRAPTPEPPGLPGGGPLRALPEVGSGPAVRPPPMTWNDLTEKARSFATPEQFTSYAMRTPAVRAQLRGRSMAPDAFYREATAIPESKIAPQPQAPSSAPTPAKRLDLPDKQLEEIFGIEIEPPRRFERTVAGEQGVVPGTPGRAMPPTATKAKTPQSPLESSPLFGQAQAAREAKLAKAQEGLQFEAHDPQRAAVQEWLTDQLGSGFAMDLATAKSPLAIRPAVRAKLQSLGISADDAWDVTHAAVPKASSVDRLVAKSMGAEPKEIPTSGLRPGAFQIKGGFEHGIPNLADPDDVYSLVQRAGRLKVTEDYAGELRDVSAFFKSKNGTTLDQLAEGLADEYPALGERGDIKEQLIGTLRRYPTLKAEKTAAKGKVGPIEAAEQAKTTEINTGMPPGDVPVSPDEWTVMGPVERRSAIEFFREAFTDETGRLNMAQMVAALKRFRQKFPMEEAVRKARPISPAISEVERWATGLADGLQMVATAPWWKQLRKVNPELLKDAETAAIAEWQANGGTAQAARQARHHFPPEVQAAMRHRDIQLQREQASRAYFGLDPIPETTGPYLPRRTLAESREAVSLGGGQLGVGRGLQSSVRGHGQERTFESYRQGEATGLEYEDPRNAILLREWEGLKLRATHRLFQNMEQKGGLFRDQAAAGAASPTGRPWRVENAPGGGTWWTPTEAEAKFLQQNLTDSARGTMGSLVGYANGLLRNPNLVQPLPHIVKNMAMKALLARGPVAPYTLARDAVEWARGSNPALLAEFNEAMPFSQSGRTAGDILGHELRGGTLSDGVRTALRWLGTVNRPSQKVIFEWADPAMRYSLFKHYRQQGKGVYDAGWNAWTDLIRYGTRSTATDFWKSVPLNFFVPWRFGTMVSLAKQVRNHPIRTALLLGVVDYLREARYRASGKWTHLPQDYTEKPVATLIQEGKLKDVAAVLGTTAMFGPGGDFSAKQVGDAIALLQGKPHQFEVDRLKNAFWGIAQIYNLPEEFKKGDYTGMLATAMLGEHNTLSYQPRRLMRDVPEWLPLMERSPLVQRAEAMQAEKRARTEKADARRAEKPRSTIEDKLRQAGYLK